MLCSDLLPSHPLSRVKSFRRLLLLPLLSATVWAQSVSVTPSSTALSAAGGSITFTVVLTYPGSASSVAFQVDTVPAGWTFGTVSGTNVPQISPPTGETGRFEFAYLTIPVSPASFTFTARYPAGLVGNQVFSGITGIVRVPGGASLPSAPVITFSPPAGAAVAPAIVTPPAGATINVGASHTLAVTATGSAPLSYQWRKGGVAVAGATGTTLVLANVTTAAAGSYTVVVTNAAGSANSDNAPAIITVGNPLPVTPPPVTPPAATPPTITTPPTASTVALGASVTLGVTANGTSPLTYQWRKDGASIAGATNATLALTNVTAATAGSYSVVVANAAGSTTSSAAQVTVPSGAGPAGTYVGTFGNNGGHFALLVRPDRTGVFVGYAHASRSAVVSRAITLSVDGRFSADVPREVSAQSPTHEGPATAAQEGVFRLSGTIAADGKLTGSVPALDLGFSAPAGTQTGPTSDFAGFYQSGVAGSSSVGYTLLGPAGEAVMVVVSGTNAEGGRGNLDPSGRFTINTASGARFSGEVRTDKVLTAAYSPTSGVPTTFQGANQEARTDIEKLVNISTRSRAGSGAESLIVGFVITGTSPKPVLVRAIGPSLAGFGVAGALAAARLEVFRAGTSLAVSNNWGEVGGGPNAVAAAAAQVSAFPLSPTSRDAALLLNLTPGDYTAVVTGQAGESGVALVEVYDATVGPIPRAQRIINLATRSRAGSGDNLLIAGFYIAGTVPKRVLVRGAGPALAQFGVNDALARPELAVYSGDTALVRNTGWSNSPDVAAITKAAAQVGAFAFPVASADTAVILSLAPGAYTVQLGGAVGTSGNALIEIYELP